MLCNGDFISVVFYNKIPILTYAKYAKCTNCPSNWIKLLIIFEFVMKMSHNITILKFNYDSSKLD